MTYPHSVEIWHVDRNCLYSIVRNIESEQGSHDVDSVVWKIRETIC